MSAFVKLTLLLALFALNEVAALGGKLPIGVGGRTIHHFRTEAESKSDERKQVDTDPADLYPVQYFEIPINHFPNKSRYAPHESGTFKNRYWFDASHHKPGGPVIILQSGESDAAERLVFMQKGILAQLAEATNGIAVVFEHRYYGKSFPTESLSTKNMRFLSTEQGMADEAYFAQNIILPGMESMNLTSHTTAYISYGGSYPGAMSAFLRIKYPDIFWGSISSAGVTKAIYDYWHYFAMPAKYGPAFCMSTQQLFINMTDNILMGRNDSKLTSELKHLFGLENVTSDADFANQLASGVGWWQSLNWDPEVSNPAFYRFCNNLTSLEVLYPEAESRRTQAAYIIEQGGHIPEPFLVNQLLNYIGWINLTAVHPCKARELSQDTCFSNLNPTFYAQDGLNTYEWRSWAYQYCTEWGYLATGSGVPANQMPLVSRKLDLEYLSTVCREAFGITSLPDLEEVNQYGGYNISYERLAIIDGEWDPWRPATPHAFEYGAHDRASTTKEPFIMIAEALHHYDENGLFPNETTPTLPPSAIVETQREEVRFVKAWMEEWKQHCKLRGDCSGTFAPALVMQL